MDELWEELTEPDPNEEAYIAAQKALKEAYAAIGEAMDSIYEAVQEARGTEFEDRIASLMNDVEDLQCDVETMRRMLD